MITAVLDPRRDRALLPANAHYTDDSPSGTRVTKAEWYRVGMTVIVPDHVDEARAAFEEGLNEEHRRPGQAYGLALWESQEHSLMLITSAAAIEAYRAGTALDPNAPGNAVYDAWPRRQGPWKDIIPATTWFPGGVGILAELPGTAGGTVTLYEYTIDRGLAWGGREETGERVSMVSWHCSRCHNPGDHDLGERWENQEPNDRQWASRKARLHAAGRGEPCTPPDGRIERAAAQVASELSGRRVDPLTPEAHCATGDGCARIRQARAVTARLVAA